jgi:hypothetical protein
MSTAELTEWESLPSFACCLAPGGPPDKENQVKMYKKYCYTMGAKSIAPVPQK